MNFLIALVLVFGLSVYFQHTIKSSSIFLYLISILITGTEIIAKFFNLSDVVGDFFYPMFANGIVSMAMFTLVMFSSAVPDNSKFQKAISPIRGELSIIASILALGHNFSVGITALKDFDTWSPFTARFSELIIIISFTGIAIMVFLLSISFKFVRSHLPRRNWKNAQKLAYVMYTLIFVQILFVSLPLAFEGDTHYLINSVVYATTFLTYATLRLLKAYNYDYRTAHLYWLGCSYLLVAIIVIAAKTHTPEVVSSSSSGSSVTGGQDNSPPAYTLNDDTTNLFVEDIENPTSSGFVIGGGSNSSNSSIAFDEDLSIYADGQYSGVGEGLQGSIMVHITILDGELTDITIGENDETPSRISRTFAMIYDIIDTQSLDVDVASGATFSSNGILEGIRNALSSAPLL